MRKCILRRIVLVLAMIAVTGLSFFCVIHSDHSGFQFGIRR